MVIQRMIHSFSSLQWLPSPQIESDVWRSFHKPFIWRHTLENEGTSFLFGWTHSTTKMLLQMVQIESNLAFTDNLPISVCKNCLLDRSRSWLWGHSQRPCLCLYPSSLWHIFPSLPPPTTLTVTLFHPLFPKQEVGHLDLMSSRDTQVTWQHGLSLLLIVTFCLLVCF